MARRIARKRAVQYPRYVRPHTLRIGDAIRVAWKEHDVEFSIVGKIGEITEHGYRTWYMTPGRFAMFTVDGNGNVLALMGLDEKAHCRITLLDSKDETATPLEGVDNAIQ